MFLSFYITDILIERRIVPVFLLLTICSFILIFLPIWCSCSACNCNFIINSFFPLLPLACVLFFNYSLDLIYDFFRCLIIITAHTIYIISSHDLHTISLTIDYYTFTATIYFVVANISSNNYKPIYNWDAYPFLKISLYFFILFIFATYAVNINIFSTILFYFIRFAMCVYFTMNEWMKWELCKQLRERKTYKCTWLKFMPMLFFPV